MEERNLEQKFDELFGVFTQAVSELAGRQGMPQGYALETREVNFSVGGQEFGLIAARCQTRPSTDKTETGLTAHASLQRNDQSLAKFQLHTREWEWKLVCESPLVPAEVNSKTVRELLESELRDSTL